MSYMFQQIIVMSLYRQALQNPNVEVKLASADDFTVYGGSS